MIFYKKLLLIILFQLDKYLEMFLANCLVEALMIRGEWNTGVGTNGRGIRTQEGPSSSASMVPSSSSASSRVVDSLEEKGTMVLGGLFLWERSTRFVGSRFETRCILENFIDRWVFCDDFFWLFIKVLAKEGLLGEGVLKIIFCT